MEENLIFSQKKSRLEPIVEKRIYPFVRATQLTDVSLYWLPVDEYPIPARGRDWLHEFFPRLKLFMQKEKGTRLEQFVQFKSLYPDLLDTFLKRSQDYHPMTGLLLEPGVAPPQLPTFEDIEAEVKKGGVVNVTQWMADYCYWFLLRKDEAQRQDFFGLGAMLFLFMAPDPKTALPKMEIPKMMRTHPALMGVDVEEKMGIAFSLQDRFLAESKNVFGELVKEDPVYPGLPYILPLLKSKSFFEATEEQRKSWFDVFEGYCIESKSDCGILLAFKDPDMDRAIADIVQSLHEESKDYPL